MTAETLMSQVAIVLIVAALAFLIVADLFAATFEGIFSDPTLLGPKPPWVVRLRQTVDHMLDGFLLLLALLILLALLLLRFWPDQGWP